MRNRALTVLLCCLLTVLPLAGQAQMGPGAMGSGGSGMMSGMMDGGGAMWLMMLVPVVIVLLVVTALILGIMALAKYLRSR